MAVAEVEEVICLNKLILNSVNILIGFISVWLTFFFIHQQFPIYLGIYGKLFRYVELIFVSTLLLNHVLFTFIKKINQKMIVLHIVLYYSIIFISFFDFFFFLIIVMPLLFPSCFLDLLLLKPYYNSQQEFEVNNIKIVQGLIMVVFLLIAYSISAILAIYVIEAYQSDGFIGYDIFAFNLISTYNLSTFSSIVSASVCFIACSLFALKAFDGAYGKKRFDSDISFDLEFKSKEVKIYWLDLVFLSTLILTLLSRFFYVLIEIIKRISRNQEISYAIRRSLIIGIPGLGVLIIIVSIYYSFEKLANRVAS